MYDSEGDCYIVIKLGLAGIGILILLTPNDLTGGSYVTPGHRT
jgi:hypothetical protein